MSFRHLDRYAGVPSPVTRRPPALRVAATVVLALGAALLPLGAWPQIAALAAVVLALGALARIRPRHFAARLAPPLAFVALVSVAVLLLAPGTAVARVGPGHVTDAGLLRFGSVTGRAAVALGAAVVLVSTTRFTELVDALRVLRLPAAVTASLGLAYRFLYILTDQIDRLRRAARSRNAGAGAAPRRRLLLGIAAVSLHRSLFRSERVHQAMLSRGYDGRILALDPAPAAGRPVLEAAALATVVGAVVASAYL